MAIITGSKTQPTYDVVIVGSGASGGQAAYTLAMAGAKVLVIEAGRAYDPSRETPMFQLPYQAPLRGAPTPEKPFGFYDASISPNPKDEPYTNASTNPAERFDWARLRMLGGRTNHWGRSANRYGPYDFKGYSRDGIGMDWPISYEDVAPYFDKVEMLVGACGSTDYTIENMPHPSPGVLLPAPKLRASDLYFKKHARKLGMEVIPAHRMVLTQPLDYNRVPAKLHPNNPKAQRILAEDMKGRAPCFWATACGRGCSIRANFQSTTVLFPPALATGNLDILPDTMVREIIVGPDGKATGVSCIDKKTGEEKHIAGRLVVLAAGSYDSVRLLLNSKSAHFANGLANSSGLLGKYITHYTYGGSISCHIPLFENLPPHDEDGAGGPHMQIPWWLYADQKAGKLDFPRGYRLGGGASPGMPSLRTGAGLEWLTQGSYGSKFKEDVRRYYGAIWSFGAYGEMVPNKDCFCEIDPTVKDRWGIPVLRFHWKWSDYERRQQVHKRKTILAVIDVMGGRLMSDSLADFDERLEKGGSGNHNLGGAIMGDKPSNSVTNQWGQTWDVKNLFVIDGATFCTQSHLPPTETMMALAWRSADYMLESMARREV